MAAGSLITAEMTLGEAVQRVAQQYARRGAIVFGEQRISYRQLDKQVTTLASGLGKLGLSEGDKVGIILPNCPEWVYAFFAIARMAGVIVPISPQLRRQELWQVLSNCEASAVITLAEVPGSRLAATIEDLRPELPHLRHIIVHGEGGPADLSRLSELMESKAPRNTFQVSPDPDDLAALVYTSGTTGVPKGTMHTHRNLIAPVVATLRLREAWMPKPSLESAIRVAKALRRYRSRLVRAAGKQQTLLAGTSYHGIAGFEVVLQALLTGDKLVILERFDPVKALQTMQKEKVSILIAVPTMLAVMLRVRDFDKYNLSSLLVCGTGAAPCPPQLAYEVKKRMGCAMAIGFGSTELGGGVMTSSLDDSDALQAETVGQVLPGVEVKVVDEQRQELPPGEVGELVVRVDSVMKGYYKAPEATAEVLDEDGWYYTGDLASIDGNGYVRIVGRKKDMIIRAGQNVYPKEIEEYLLRHPGIREVAVVGVPGPLGSERVWAYVVPEAGVSLSAREVLEFCRGQIAAYKLPDEVQLASELPTSALGEVQKFKLREFALEELQKRKTRPSSAKA
jgi:fatty-acyl-CoA synthase